MKKVLVCGDSYCCTDPAYPGLHWSEKIAKILPDYEMINLSYGGCSNALIALQLLNGLQFTPDFVIISFTGPRRYEIDNKHDAVPNEFTAMAMSAYLKDRYISITSNSTHSSTLRAWITESSDNLEKIKDYFYICFCLQTLALQGKNFCYSLGGFEYKQDYTALLNANYIQNVFPEYKAHEIKTNLWFHGNKTSPFFHVDNDGIQQLFASECLAKMKHG